MMFDKRHSVTDLELAAPEWDPAAATGGNPLEVNVNAPYALQEFHYIYLMLCAFVVWLIIPGVGLLYGGLARRKSSLALLFQSLLVTAVSTFTWMFWGYSLAFSRTANVFIGDLTNFGLRNVGVAPSPGSAYIPEIVFCFYQMLFCAVTAQLVIGGSFERGRIVPSLVFTFLWVTIVYCPIACWTWNSNGWLYNLPSLDFAGGGPVHMASGWSALAYAFILGKRKNAQSTAHSKPHNTTLVFLGTVLIWFGWFGFNGGSALNATVRSMHAIFATQAAASSGVLGWVLIDLVRTGKFSVVGACEGAIAGLVGITPAAGYVSLWIAFLIGFLTAVVCALGQNVHLWLGIDEGMDVFKLHGVGGMVGSFLTGIFAQQWVGALDGVSTGYSGAMDGVGVQVGRQIAEIVAIGAYAFGVSCVLLLALKYTPGMRLRVGEEAEMIGLDLDQFCDEQIGDWSMLEQNALVGASTPASGGSVHKVEEGAKAA